MEDEHDMPDVNGGDVPSASASDAPDGVHPSVADHDHVMNINGD